MSKRLCAALLFTALLAAGCKAPSDRIHTADGGVIVGKLESIRNGIAGIGGLSVQVPTGAARVWGRNGASYLGTVSMEDRVLSVNSREGTVEIPIRSVSAIVWGETSVTSRVFDVPLEAGWINTHVVVSRGDIISVSSGGTVFTEAGTSSPDGTEKFSTTTALAPQAVGGALVMRVGTEGTVIQTGSQWSGSATDDGEIFLGVNAHIPGSTVSGGRYTAALTTGSGPGAGVTVVLPAGKPRFPF